MTPLTVVYPRIEDALETVTEELTIAEAETEAFGAFRSRVRQLAPVETRGPAAGGGLVTTTTVVGINPDDVRDAYRDTVIAMDHYEREYGEPFLENVGKEFGPSVRQLADRGVPLSEAQVGAIDAAAEQAVEERRRFASALESEQQSLETVTHRLGEIERQFHECCQAREKAERSRAGSVVTDGGDGDPAHSECLLELVDDCQTLAEERQGVIHRGSPKTISGIDESSLHGFLYGATDTRFPALGEIVTLAEGIESAIYE